MKSRAYDPEHYKVDDSADHEDLHKYESQPQQEAQPKQERKANFLTRGFYLSRHERPRTPTQPTLPTSQGFIASSNGQKLSDPTTFEMIETQNHQLMIAKDLNQHLALENNSNYQSNQRRLVAASTEEESPSDRLDD